MSRLKFIFDALIFCLFLALLFFLYQTEPLPQKSQDFHPGDFDYHSLRRLVFRVPDFVVEVPDLNHPQLLYQGRIIPASSEWLNRYINNIFTLPEMNEFAMADTSSAYGFQEKPDVIVEGANEAFAMFLGTPVPGNADFFYFSFREGYVTQLAGVYRGNIKWSKELFLRRSPLSKDWKILNFKDSEFPILTGVFFSRLEGRILSEGKSDNFDPLSFAMDGQGLYLEATFNVSDFSGCKYFLTVDKEDIHTCNQGFLNVTYDYGWKHNEASRNWAERFPMNLFSRKFSHYVPENIFQVTRLVLSDGRVLSDDLYSFAIRIKRLQDIEGIVSASPFAGKPFALHFGEGKDGFSLQGILSGDDLFSFLISNNYYFQMDLKWLLH